MEYHSKLKFGSILKAILTAKFKTQNSYHLPRLTGFYKYYISKYSLGKRPCIKFAHNTIRHSPNERI